MLAKVYLLEAFSSNFHFFLWKIEKICKLAPQRQQVHGIVHQQKSCQWLSGADARSPSVSISSHVWLVMLKTHMSPKATMPVGLPLASLPPAPPVIGNILINCIVSQCLPFQDLHWWGCDSRLYLLAKDASSQDSHSSRASSDLQSTDFI